MKTYICIVCGFVYDETVGRPEDGTDPKLINMAEFLVDLKPESEWKNSGSMSAKSFSAAMRSRRTEPTMPRQPTKPTNLLISTPFQCKQTMPDLGCLLRLVWPGAHDDTGAGSALNGRGFGNDCARGLGCLGGSQQAH